MRVVAGALRGRRLDAPPGRDVRPTTDRVREAMFNALGSLDVVVDAEVVDLFAGSGALGIEALSRGAAHCTFVERDRAALGVLRANLRALGLEDRSTVVGADAATWSGLGRDATDLVLADPPYGSTDWAALLDQIAAPFVVAESDDEVEPPVGWEAVRVRRYGRTWLTFLHRVP